MKYAGDSSQLTPLQLETLLTEGNTSRFWLVCTTYFKLFSSLLGKIWQRETCFIIVINLLLDNYPIDVYFLWIIVEHVILQLLPSLKAIASILLFHIAYCKFSCKADWVLILSNLTLFLVQWDGLFFVILKKDMNSSFAGWISFFIITCMCSTKPGFYWSLSHVISQLHNIAWLISDTGSISLKKCYSSH